MNETNQPDTANPELIDVTPGMKQSAANKVQTDDCTDIDRDPDEVADDTLKGILGEEIVAEWFDETGVPHVAQGHFDAYDFDVFGGEHSVEVKTRWLNEGANEGKDDLPVREEWQCHADYYVLVLVDRSQSYGVVVGWCPAAVTRAAEAHDYGAADKRFVPHEYLDHDTDAFVREVAPEFASATEVTA